MPSSEERMQLFGHPTNVLRGQTALDTDATAVYVRAPELEPGEEATKSAETTRDYINQLELDGYL